MNHKAARLSLEFFTNNTSAMQKHIEVTRELIISLREVIELQEEKRAVELLKDLHPADIAEVFEIMSMEEVIFLFLLLDPEIAADVTTELEEDDREKLLKRWAVRPLLKRKDCW